MRWVLSAGAAAGKEINAVEEGTRESLGGGYPRELSGVATNLNTLLIGERNRLARYRDSLGNPRARTEDAAARSCSTTMHGAAAGASTACSAVRSIA